MWPWGHVAVGYLLYSGWRRLRGEGRPSGIAAVAVAVGAVLPDLVDKPLAWWFVVLPTGRTLAHSLLFVVPVVGVLWWVAGDRHADAVSATALGWLSHLAADGIGASPAYLGYLLWPATTTPPYPTEQSFSAHVAEIEMTPFFLAQLGLVALAGVVWHRDGRPGLAVVRNGLARTLGAAPSE